MLNIEWLFTKEVINLKKKTRQTFSKIIVYVVVVVMVFGVLVSGAEFLIK